MKSVRIFVPAVERNLIARSVAVTGTSMEAAEIVGIQIPKCTNGEKQTAAMVVRRLRVINLMPSWQIRTVAYCELESTGGSQMRQWPNSWVGIEPKF